MKTPPREPDPPAEPPRDPAESVPPAPPTPDAPALKVEWWPIDRPKPYPRNARKWSAYAIQKLAASIQAFGWVQPVVCDSQDVIVIGHLRMAAARYLNLERVPVHVASDLSPEKIKALRIADNRLHSESEFDQIQLGADLIDLKIANFDLKLTGFDNDEIVQSVFGVFGGKGKATDKASGNLDPGGNRYKEQYGVIVICKSEPDQELVYNKLRDLGYECKVVTT